MDERDAISQGLTVHRRDMAFVRGYVSCANCACNYDASKPDEKTFCQIYSMPVNPTETEKCTNTAEACEQWVGVGMDRNQVVTPAHKYRYED